MNHCGTKTIETEHLILRAFQLDDAGDAYRNWTSDEKVTEFLTWPVHADISVTKQVIGEWVEQYKRSDFYQWAIVLKEINASVGSISAIIKNEKTSTVNIGYCIGSQWWHQGITSEAFRTVIDFLFREVDVNRIEAKHDPNNPYSGGVMKKCGLKHEGTLRQAGYNNQGITDECIYSLLKSEWP